MRMAGSLPIQLASHHHFDTERRSSASLCPGLADRERSAGGEGMQGEYRVSLAAILSLSTEVAVALDAELFCQFRRKCEQRHDQALY
jgi:hypothetical protein